MTKTWTACLFLFLHLVVGKDGSADDKVSRLNFLALGDWGGTGALLFSSLWSPLYPIHQAEVATGMAKVARRDTTDFVVALGDNFYVRGISNSFDRVQETFEDVYKEEALQIPWYVIAGNHDHYGNVTLQLEYTNYSKAKSESDPRFVHRWEFPSLFHKQSFTRGNLTLDLILIDTVVLEQARVRRWHPSFWNKDRTIVNAAEQWDWLETALKASSHADYLLVGGHFPVFSQGGHGPTPFLVQQLKPLLEKYQVSVYLSGHEHSLMHYQQDNHGVAYVVSGAGNSCCCWRRSKYQQQHEKDFPDIPLQWHMFYQDNYFHRIKGGFASLRASMDALIVQYHDQEGNVLYEADPILPRKKSLGGVGAVDVEYS